MRKKNLKSFLGFFVCLFGFLKRGNRMIEEKGGSAWFLKLGFIDLLPLLWRLSYHLAQRCDTPTCQMCR